jgi:hypothetical protein
MDLELLSAGQAALQRKQELFSFLVLNNGAMVVAWCFKGSAANQANNIHSASKSMIGGLVGLAIANGFIPSIDTSDAELPPEHLATLGSNNKSIKIRHLLTRSAGLDLEEDASECCRVDLWPEAPSPCRAQNTRGKL